MENNLLEWLFETNALRIAPADKPFWYTSGKLGLFYVNTHFLYGSEEKAVNLLNIIDETKEKNPAELINKLNKEILNNYNEDNIFQGLINNMIEYINENISINEFEYISGGERRDWFFSLIIAKILNKKHITIFKNLSMVIYDYDKEMLYKDDNLKGAKVLHIADLITEASSYERAWIPAIKSINGQITQSIVVVDRDQGGEQVLKNNGIESHCLCKFNYKLFVKALSLGCINEEQYVIVKEYLKDPEGAMKKFIKENPDFINNAVNSDDKKISETAKRCIEKGYYQEDIKK